MNKTIEQLHLEAIEDNVVLDTMHNGHDGIEYIAGTEKASKSCVAITQSVAIKFNIWAGKKGWDYDGVNTWYKEIYIKGYPPFAQTESQILTSQQLFTLFKQQTGL